MIIDLLSLQQSSLQLPNLISGAIISANYGYFDVIRNMSRFPGIWIPRNLEAFCHLVSNSLDYSSVVGMALISTVKTFVSKKNFDWGRTDITLHNFHPQLQWSFVVNGIFFNNRESMLRFVYPVLSILLSLVAVSFEIFFIWHGLEIQDYNFATECFCYLIILGTVSIVYSSMLLNRKKIFGLLTNMNNDFLFICTLEPEYRDTFLKGQLVIWKLCWSWITIASFVSILYILNTTLYLLYQSTFATQDEHMVRPLMFPLWLPEDDPYRTPNYEIFFFIEIILVFVVLLTFGFYVYILFHLLLHYYFLMDMIMIAFGELFVGVDESVAVLPRLDPRRGAAQAELNRRMGRIVRWHNSIFASVNTISSVYGPTLVYQMTLSSVIMCLIAYQVEDQLSEGKIDYLFGMLGIVGCLQLWIPCYIGTQLRNKAFSVGDRCFNCGWHSTPLAQLVRQDLILFILRAQKPVAIKFTAMPHLQLETFSSIMSTAYSYFNMLRQYK